MTSFFDSWRRHLWLWVLPLGFCVLNLIGVAVYHWAFAGQVESLEKRYQTSSNRLKQYQDEQVVIEDFLTRIESHKTAVKGLHRDRFRTEEQRFTEVIQEVKKLARQAGLRPTALSYPSRPFTSHRLIQRNINFSVKGSYEQLRNFINFLELSEHFITLNSVTLGGGEDPREPGLSIQLVVSTIFTTRRLPAENRVSSVETTAAAEEPAS